MRSLGMLAVADAESETDDRDGANCWDGCAETWVTTMKNAINVAAAAGKTECGILIMMPSLLLERVARARRWRHGSTRRSIFRRPRAKASRRTAGAPAGWG